MKKDSIALNQFSQTVKQIQIIHDFLLEKIMAIAPRYQELNECCKRAKDAYNEAEVEYEMAEAKNESKIEKGQRLASSKADLDSAENELEPVKTELRGWLDQTPKRTIVALYSAFEVFLKQRLIEYVISRPEDCLVNIQNRPNLNQLYEKLKEGNYPIEETVTHLIDQQCHSFHKFWGEHVNKIYEDLTGISPFSTDYQNDKLPPNDFIKNYETLIDTVIDMRLLHAMRNHFVHGFYATSKRFEQTLEDIEYEIEMLENNEMEKKKGKMCYGCRLHEDVQKNYPDEVHPRPIDILLWDNVEKEPSKASVIKTAFQQFFDSVLRYAGYIDSICAGQSAISARR